MEAIPKETDATSVENERRAMPQVPPTIGPGQGGPALDRDEELLVVLRGIGAVMFLTSRRIIVARDGIERRPRTGIQSFPLVEILHLRLELGSPPSGRIALWTIRGQEAVSMFFDARSLDRARSLIDLARPLVARQRSRGQGAGRVPPPSGPAGSVPPDSAEAD